MQLLKDVAQKARFAAMQPAAVQARNDEAAAQSPKQDTVVATWQANGRNWRELRVWSKGNGNCGCQSLGTGTTIGSGCGAGGVSQGSSAQALPVTAAVTAVMMPAAMRQRAASDFARPDTLALGLGMGSATFREPHRFRRHRGDGGRRRG